MAPSDAETRAVQLFDEAVRRGLVAPGVTEGRLPDQIGDLANELFGVRKRWHERIVRRGVNTLEPNRTDPADLTLEADDIVPFDLGPVFEVWEADVGRTHVLGDDEHEHRLDRGRVRRVEHLGDRPPTDLGGGGRGLDPPGGVEAVAGDGDRLAADQARGPSRTFK